MDDKYTSNDNDETYSSGWYLSMQRLASGTRGKHRTHFCNLLSDVTNFKYIYIVKEDAVWHCSHTMSTSSLSLLSGFYPPNRTLISAVLAIVIASRVIKLLKGLRVNTDV